MVESILQVLLFIYYWLKTKHNYLKREMKKWRKKK